jgi:hypothetical protein
MSPYEDRYLVEVASEDARDARPFFLLPSCASIDAPHKRPRRRRAVARAQERVAALKQAHQDRQGGPRGRYAVRCG